MPLKTLRCPRGHTFALSENERARFVPCPECGNDVLANADAQERDKPGRKGLWAMMGAPTTDELPDEIEKITERPSVSVPSSRDLEGLPDEVTLEDLPQVAETPSTSGSRSRGLWALMGAPSDESAASADLPTTNSPDEEPSAEDCDVPVAADDSEAAVADDDSDDEDAWEVEDPDGEARVAEPVATPTYAPRGSASKKKSSGGGALVVACLALCFLPLHLLPWWWAKWPAGLMGLVSVLMGQQSLSRATARQRSVVPITAMVLGAIAMLAGPFGLNNVGHRSRQATTTASKDPSTRLKLVGSGLEAFHLEHGHFPAGGTTIVTADGEEVPLHGWMTALLPYIGHDELAKQIDMTRSYDHQVNLPVMSIPIETYLSLGTPHTPTLLGLATTHFSGVGGDRETETGTVSLGIFDLNSRVRRDAIVDGLSQTAVVGEIRENLPAWGDPENWRQVDGALNEHPYGFGNAAGTGAHFLMADGSVKFVSNQTSLEVLQRMSTRNAGD